MRAVLRLVLIFEVVLLSAPVYAWAQWEQFIPRIWDTAAWIETDGYYESHKSTLGGTGLNTTDTYLAGKFVFSAAGWVYHPRFLVFLAKIGTGLAFERVTNDAPFAPSTGSKTSFLREYEFRTIILPEHPYNLELYTVRQNPYIRGRVVLGLAAVEDDKGVIFRYKERPYAFNLSYNQVTVESSQFSTSTTRLRTNGVYFKDWGTFAASFTHENSDNTFLSSGGNLSSNEYTFENQLRFLKSKLNIESDLSLITLNQNMPFETLNDSRFSWNEKVNYEFPWHFNTQVYYTLFHETADRSGGSAGIANTLTDTSYNAGLSVTHRLYQSLVTSYNINYLSVATTTGDTKGTSQSLSTAYTKRIPGGQLIAGLNFSRTSLTRTGAPSIVNENQTAQLFGEFVLQQTDVDTTSISIKVKSPLTGNLVDLTRDIHFLVFPIGNTVRIKIISIPPEAFSPDPSFNYGFEVTYSLVPENADVTTTTYGGSLKLELFDHFVNPYASYTHGEQSISGTFAGTPVNFTSTVYGLLLQKWAFSLLGEYQNYQSNTNPYEVMRAEANYRNSIGAGAFLSGQAFYRITKYGATSFGQNSFTEKLFGGSFLLQKNFPRKNLSFTVGGNFTQVTGLATTRTYSVNSNLTWALGQLEVKAGAGYGRSQSDITSLKLGSLKEESMYQSYYLTIRRQLF
jgi:hypothetical protein